MPTAGLSAVRVFTRYWFALLGEWPWQKTPNLPPEVIFFPTWFPFNIYNFASWARATILPLTILSARHVVRPLPPDCRLDELFPEGRERMNYDLPARNGVWQSFFFAADKFLHAYQNLGVLPASRGRHPAECGMDYPPPGCGRGLGWDSAAVDL